MTTFLIPIRDHGDLTDMSGPDRWKEVPSRAAGVPGLVVTALSSRTEPKGYVEGRWQLTQRATGRALGSYTFESIAAARRAAKRVAHMADWTDPELIYDWQKPSMKSLKKRIGVQLRAETEQT